YRGDRLLQQPVVSGRYGGARGGVLLRFPKPPPHARPARRCRLCSAGRPGSALAESRSERRLLRGGLPARHPLRRSCPRPRRPGRAGGHRVVALPRGRVALAMGDPSQPRLPTSARRTPRGLRPPFFGLPMIRPISAAETRPLRSLVLRPGAPPETLVYPGDDHPEALHLGAFEGDRLVGIATVYPEP